MSEWAVFLSWVMLVALVTFHESAEAVPSDKDLTILTYNWKTDACSNVKPDEDPSVKVNADATCKEAFHALDRTEGNACVGWEQPECRLIEGYHYYQCSCTMIVRARRGFQTKTAAFHECAYKLQKKHERTRKIPAPSASYQREQRDIRKEELKSLVRRHQEAISARRNYGAPEGWYEEGSSSTAAGSIARSRRGASPSRQEGSSSSSAALAGSFSLQGRTSNTPPWEPKCDICGQEFPTVDKLQSHARLHGGGTYCEYCGTQFPEKAALQAHYGPCAAAYKNRKKISPSPWSTW